MVFYAGMAGFESGDQMSPGSGSTRCSSTSTACSPTPRASTRPAGSRRSTSSCVAAPMPSATRSGPSTSRATTGATWTASGASTACGTSSPRGGSTCPKARRATRPTPRPSAGVGNRKNELVNQALARAASRSIRASVALVRRLRDAGKKTAVVSSSANCGAVLGRRASRISSRSAWTARWPRSSACPASRRRTPSSTRRACSASTPSAHGGGGGRHLRRPGGPRRRLRPGRRRRAPRRAGRPARGRRGRGGRRPRRALGTRGRRLSADAPARTRASAPATSIPPTSGAWWRGASIRAAWPSSRRSSRSRTATSACGATSTKGPPPSTNATLVNGFHETWPIVYGEKAHGFAKTGQTILNVTDAKIIRLYVDDEPFYLPTASLLDYERVLDMRAGTLDRTILWETPAGKRVSIKSRRLVSFEHRHLAAIDYEVTVVNAEAPVVISSEARLRPGQRHRERRRSAPRAGLRGPRPAAASTASRTAIASCSATGPAAAG